MKADFKVAINVPYAAGPNRGKPHTDKLKPTDRLPSRPPRIALLMALAIYMERLLRDGHAESQGELASLAGITRARITQILNLLGLAPDIQEQLLLNNKSNRFVERTLRPLCMVANWNEQRGAATAWSRESCKTLRPSGATG